MKLIETVQIKLGHILHSMQWFLGSVDTGRLDSIDRVIGVNVVGKFLELHQTAQAVCNDNRRSLPASFNLYEGRCSGLGQHGALTMLAAMTAAGTETLVIASSSTGCLLIVNPCLLDHRF